VRLTSTGGEPASAYIWALVSGLAGARRRNRLLLMLQAYIDESFTIDPPIYAMAGFIAPAEKWAAFSDEWALCLSPIKHFKMNDAMTLDGEFRWWREDNRDEKVALLRAIIDEHVTAAIACAVRPDELARVFDGDGLPKRLLSPYYFLLHVMIGELATRQRTLGLNEKVDFIFDDQIMEKGKIIDDWEIFKRATRAPKELIGDVPTFRDDKIVMPLQAADMHAWISRRRMQEDILGWPRLELPQNKRSPTKRVPSLGLVWTENSLRKMRSQMMQYRPLISGDFGPWRFFGEPGSIFVEERSS
jgi:hypothetical protein